MEIGIVGLGRMGGGMAARLASGGHRVVVHARRPEQVKAIVAEGAIGAASYEELVAALTAPRIVWMMLPAGEATEAAVRELSARLAPGDLLVDGGNSNYRDSQRRAAEVARSGIGYVDVGVSGGVWGRTEGYSLMAGGRPEAVARLHPLFQSLAPTPDTGWGRVGGPGAGHFVKMVHNGIEYGLMEAYAEGFAILDAKKELGLDLADIARIWQRGSVVRSWLLDLCRAALEDRGALDAIAPRVADSGEGRWTVDEAMDLGISAPVITLALERRIRSRETDPLAEKLLAAMRQKFGGHAIETEAAPSPPRRDARRA
ncbi:MAG: phosphogluconate dehydrogenase (NAD(+)-dependent, decarboxylating) [Thermoplasmata archaeon]